MSWKDLNNLILTNNIVELRRIHIKDRDEFSQIVYNPEIWRYFVTQITNEAELDTFLEHAIQDTLNGTRIVFAIINKKNHRIVGSTAYGNLSKTERRLEIGWTWLCAKARGTEINHATKFALLNHAFEVLKCERVEFKTDAQNTAARIALSKIGAYEEGILRSFNYMPKGHRRDIVYYSILKNEWPAIKNERFKSSIYGLKPLI